MSRDSWSRSGHRTHSQRCTRRPKMTPRIIRFPEVDARSGMSRSTIYLRIAERLFPHPIPLGPHMVGWPESGSTRWSVLASGAVRITSFASRWRGSKRHANAPENVSITTMRPYIREHHGKCARLLSARGHAGGRPDRRRSDLGRDVL